ncbi:DUF2059 domain-containing protein [Acinetobacter sp. CWB-B33]|uniref:DUF2059 domain-containing protein n=1 Tax=Acinetobacter sp. CWB-B33 TaxID=2815724 RepID=UPI0031FEA5CE
MKKINLWRHSFFLSCCLCCCTAIYAQPVQEKTLNQLIDLSNLSGLILKSSRDMRPMFDTQAEEILKMNLGITALNSQQKKAAVQISQLLQITNEDIVSDPQFLSMIRNNFRQAFTEEEAQAYIAFLSTPMGQAINQKSAGLMNNILQESLNISTAIMNDSKRQQSFNDKLASILQPLLLSN